ncbi:hypothetical protein NHF46_03455 [Arthrobacter alpinus]|nr:hypothetical protein [Arthrobacter alpinus]
MDYESVELLIGAVLALVPVAALVVAGLWCLKAPAKRMPWFFFLGPVASLIYSWTAGSLALTLFPPPYNAYFDSGRGLDLRGMIIVFGAMAGGAAGIVTSIVFCALNLMRQWSRSRASTTSRSMEHL